MTASILSRLDQARAAWGAGIPDWVEELARQVDATSQNEVARRLKRSASLVSMVLSCSYKGSYDVTEDVVRGVYMSGTLDCPQLGTIPSNVCRDWQRRPFLNTNSQRVAMFRACARCPRKEQT
jgi:hypothetical protein